MIGPERWSSTIFASLHLMIGTEMPRVGEHVKVLCQNRYCGKETWVRWGYPTNCEHCGHPVITP